MSECRLSHGLQTTHFFKPNPSGTKSSPSCSLHDTKQPHKLSASLNLCVEFGSWVLGPSLCSCVVCPQCGLLVCINKFAVMALFFPLDGRPSILSSLQTKNSVSKSSYTLTGQYFFGILAWPDPRKWSYNKNCFYFSSLGTNKGT